MSTAAFESPTRVNFEKRTPPRLSFAPLVLIAAP
jgi:hypothetical protein